MNFWKTNHCAKNWFESLYLESPWYGTKRGVGLVSLPHLYSADGCVPPEANQTEYRYAPHYDVSVNDGPHIRQWSHKIMILFFLWRCDPMRVMASSFLRFLDHTQRRTTVGRTPLDEWSARRRDLYLTTPNTHNKYPCPRWDSNPRAQQASDRRPTP